MAFKNSVKYLKVTIKYYKNIKRLWMMNQDGVKPILFYDLRQLLEGPEYYYFKRNNEVDFIDVIVRIAIEKYREWVYNSDINIIIISIILTIGIYRLCLICIIMFCKNCGAEIYENDKFCSNCGQEVKPIDENICKKCGAEIYENDKFCSSCGEKIGSNGNNNNSSGLMNCPDCGSPVSKKAKSCPNCGCPVVSMTPDGVVRIKLSNLINTMTKQTVSINGENGEELWRGKAGQIAEVYFERKTQVTIKYHTAANAWGGSCKGDIDPSKGTIYSTTVRRGILGTHIELQRVDFIDSDF